MLGVQQHGQDSHPRHVSFQDEGGPPPTRSVRISILGSHMVLGRPDLPTASPRSWCSRAVHAVGGDDAERLLDPDGARCAHCASAIWTRAIPKN